MGFSVSGTFVIVLLGMFIAIGSITTTGANTLEVISDARTDASERLDTIHDTRIAITDVTLSGSSDDCRVDVAVNNTGSSTLTLEKTSFMIDNDYQTGWRDGATVNGDSSTDLWLPGERLNVTKTGESQPPNSVTVVTKTGVTDRAITEGWSC